MRTILFSCLMLSLLACTGPAAAQQLTGRVGIGLTGGHQSNPYLDPVLREWDPAVRPSFVAVSPSAGLTWSGPGGQVYLNGRVRTDPTRLGRTGLPFAQIGGGGRYEVADRWTVGVQAGGARYRLLAARDSGWLLGRVGWRVTSTTRLALQGGVTHRINRTSATTTRQTSGVALLNARTWLTDRWRLSARGYWSANPNVTTTATYGSTGLEVGATYWPASTVSVGIDVAAEQVRYTFPDPTTSSDPGGGHPVGGPSGGSGDATTQTITRRDRLVRVGLEGEWDVQSQLTAFARAGGLWGQLNTSGTQVRAHHLAAGVRWQLQGPLAGGERPTRSRSVWTNVEEGIRFRVRYRGEGRLYLTGEFNDWAEPGLPMQRVQGNLYAATADVPPGRYQYRIRVQTESGSRWLDLPAYAKTVESAFGGVNGVCIVDEQR
jgi:hypothetical protein